MAEAEKKKEKSEEKLEEGMIRDEKGRIVPDYDQTIKVFDEGDIVTGTIVRIDRDEVLVDIGYKSEGVIPTSELAVKSNVNPEDIVSVGDSTKALVLQKEDAEGRLILSKKRAEYETAWERLEKVSEKEGTVRGKVIEVVKGGLILDIGLRGFLPASLVDLRRVKNLNEYIGEELECKVVEMDRNRNNVVLSRRAVLEGERRQEREKILSKLEKGQVLTGKISSVVDFGAFVDLGGVDGLIHISELAWTHVGHPSEVVSVGDEVKVQVLDVDHERQRISLGLKQTQEDPWREKVGRFSSGQIVEGTVAKLVPFGVFIELAEDVEGLIHISELAEKHVDRPEEVAKVGDKLKARIVDIDLDRRRISLSLKPIKEAKLAEKKRPARKIKKEVAEKKKPVKVAKKVEEKAEEEAPVEAEEKPEVEKKAVKTKEKEEKEKEKAVKVTQAAPQKEEKKVEKEEKVEKKKEAKEEPEAEQKKEPETPEEEAEKPAPKDQPEPGSLEDVLKQMKESRGKKE